jgi:hypothetical protein
MVPEAMHDWHWQFDPRPDTSPPKFYMFEAIQHVDVTTVFGVGNATYIGVNPWTGDVWDNTHCEKITSPAIKKEQESIRKKLKLTADQLQRLGQKTPYGCEPHVQ